MPSTTPYVRSRRARARASRRALALAAFACSLARVPIASGAEAAGDEPATECAASGADALLHDADVPSSADSAASARPRRLVAVPDLHGDLAHARRSLQLAGVLAPDDASDPDAWIAGADAHLVQTGDILDRGENSIDVMDLLARLSERAAAAGGEVTALLGNHELMTLQGDLSYVAREEIVRLGRENLDANKLGGEEMGTGYGLRAYWTAGQMRWTKLFRSDGTQGARLRRERTLLALAGDGACATLFSHAGLRARHLDAHGGTVDSVNAAARVAVAGDDGRRVLRSHDLFDGESPLWNRFYGDERGRGGGVRGVGRRASRGRRAADGRGAHRAGEGDANAVWGAVASHRRGRLGKIRRQRRGVVVRVPRPGKRDGSRALRRENGGVGERGRGRCDEWKTVVVRGGVRGGSVTNETGDANAHRTLSL